MAFGELTGTLIFLLSTPFLAFVFFWYVTGKDSFSGGVAFNIVLALLLFLQVMVKGQNALKTSEAISDIENLREDFDEDRRALDEGDYEKYDSLTDAYRESLKENFSILTESSNDPIERRAYGLMNEFVHETEVIVEEWQNSFDMILDERILNYSILKDDDEYAFQLETIENYISKSREYKHFIDNAVSILKEKLAPLGTDHGFVKGVIKGASNRFEERKVITIPYIEANINYGVGLKNLIEFLEKHNEQWELIDGELLFDNDELSDSYNSILEETIIEEEKVSELSQKLISG